MIFCFNEILIDSWNKVKEKQHFSILLGQKLSVLIISNTMYFIERLGYH